MKRISDQPTQNFFGMYAETQVFLAHLSLLGSLVSLKCSHGLTSACPHFSNNFFTKTTGPIKAKYHMEPQWDGGTKVCLQGLGHVTKMAAMPIYVKNPSKIFSRTKGPVTLWLGM